ncbi:MAG: hypothetical protein HUU11_16870 [Anaerolineales bacterium]|nr:hypothetical protein [Anaerolineales bacterium]
MARMKSWRGREISQAVAQNVAKALGKFGLRVEGHSKRELRRGHGVRYGTLRRSIHTAQPGYSWRGDDVKPGPGTPEMGGQIFVALVSGRRITIQVGSGLRYAMPVHQGHHSFDGYHYLTNGLEKAKPELAQDLAEYRLK